MGSATHWPFRWTHLRGSAEDLAASSHCSRWPCAHSAPSSSAQSPSHKLPTSALAPAISRDALAALPISRLSRHWRPGEHQPPDFLRFFEYGMHARIWPAGSWTGEGPRNKEVSAQRQKMHGPVLENSPSHPCKGCRVDWESSAYQILKEYPLVYSLSRAGAPARRAMPARPSHARSSASPPPLGRPSAASPHAMPGMPRAPPPPWLALPPPGLHAAPLGILPGLLPQRPLGTTPLAIRPAKWSAAGAAAASFQSCAAADQRTTCSRCSLQKDPCSPQQPVAPLQRPTNLRENPLLYQRLLNLLTRPQPPPGAPLQSAAVALPKLSRQRCQAQPLSSASMKRVCWEWYVPSVPGMLQESNAG